MKKQPKTTIKTPDLSGLSAAELRLVVAQFQAVIDEQNTALQDAHRRIELLEEMNRLLKTQKFSASSEKSKFSSTSLMNPNSKPSSMNCLILCLKRLMKVKALLSTVKSARHVNVVFLQALCVNALNTSSLN